ncbi:DUF6368 family protein [Xanthocytophaga agilis]|uniref:DUF6368 family protein n=1 Tax=Xanthocytophaga agilis TaxID=3048010 RepID=A0AAE3RAC4_9BACT|nr:DUF6368 family protein [Xanthocytophaga agilis]MDJ1503692.1 DUF6368 family protein [Xanthocytophaga agilis]
MAGASATILIDREWTSSEQKILDDMLSKTAIIIEDNNYFVVNNTFAIGGKQHEEYQSFTYTIFNINDEASYSSDECNQINEVFHSIPVTAIDFSAVTSRTNVRMLGEIVLYIANKLNGIIDFGGELLPEKAYKENDFWWIIEKANWNEVEHYYTEMIREIPGTIICIHYHTEGNRHWVYNICDVLFMKSWLDHPEFQLIK